MTLQQDNIYEFKNQLYMFICNIGPVCVNPGAQCRVNGFYGIPDTKIPILYFIHSKNKLPLYAAMEVAKNPEYYLKECN